MQAQTFHYLYCFDCLLIIISPSFVFLSLVSLLSLFLFLQHIPIMFKTFVLVALAAIAAAAFLAVPAEAGHCSRTITEETRYCCSMGCDSPYNPDGNTCAADGSSITEADIKVLADADLCSGTCSYVPSKTLKYCVDVGACPPTGCGEGFAEIKPENPRPAFPMSTQVSFYGSGFPDAMFKAHLHADTCENQGGAHFSGGDGVTVDAVNENWPAVTCVDVRKNHHRGDYCNTTDSDNTGHRCHESRSVSSRLSKFSLC